MQRRSRTALLTSLLASVALVTMISGCSSSDGDGHGSDTVTVGSDSGFTYSGPDGLKVVGSAGVASPGTDVSITPLSAAKNGAPPDSNYLDRSVEIVIGKGEQPKTPITVSIPIPASAKGDPQNIVGLTEENGKPQYLETTVSGDTVSTTLTHLSVVDFFKVDLPNFASGVGNSLHTFVTGESNQSPACLEKTVTASNGATYKATRTKTASGKNLNAVWPCLRLDGDNVILDLKANGNQNWLVRTEPDVGEGTLSAPSSGDAAASGLFKLFYDLGKHRSTATLMPGTTRSLTFSQDNPPTAAAVRADVGLMLTSALVYQVSAIFDFTGMSTYDKIEQVPGVYDCLIGVADTFNAEDTTHTDDFLSAFKSTLGCMSAVTPGPMAFMLNILNGGASVVSGLLTGAFNEAFGNNTGYIAITSTQPTPNYVQNWGGHGRSLKVRPDGTATVMLASGASNSQTWDATWSTSGGKLIVKLVRVTDSYGDMGDYYHAGDTWTGSLVSKTGYSSSGSYTVLEFANNPGVYWCSSEASLDSGICGA